MAQVTAQKMPLAGKTPPPPGEKEGEYIPYQEKLGGKKTQGRSDILKDLFSRAIMFWTSMGGRKKDHITNVFSFELGM
ncbi:hypothetical protein BLX87_22150 [Bacillus sp. VT-16-64]|nr:hypothetical protein BLX87_22150 [Bacillus sp. VT-16-64]